MKLLLFLLALGPLLTFAGPVQKSGLTLPSDAGTHRDAAQKLFEVSYEAYRTYAWGHDDLAPMTKSFVDSRNGWGASIIDAMSTMAIIGLDDWFEEAVDFASQIDFSVSKIDSDVSVFETTIRYLGGFLSAFELSGNKYPILVEKAKEVADKMAFAWRDEGQEIPFGFLNFTDNSPIIRGSNIAEAGTLVLEWETLTKYTNNNTYRDLTETALKHIANLPAPLPGLAAQGIDPQTGGFIGGYVTWGGGSDSYFEYLIKHARLTNTDDNLFTDSWLTAIDSSITNLLRRSTVGDHLYLADFDSQQRIRFISSHLACFHGGNWILGGKLLDNQTIVDIGLELVDGCWNTYASTATGIGPESFAYISRDGNFTGAATPPTAAQLEFYEKNGFYMRSTAYILRPEVLESNFIAWRATGDTKFLDRAASAIKSFETYLPATVGYAGVRNVDDISENRERFDDMESFWFAEVLKYLYLTFDDPEHISLDEYVFNTEAHPFKAPPAKAKYGTGRILPPNEEPFVVQSGPPQPEISPNSLLPDSFTEG